MNQVLIQDASVSSNVPSDIITCNMKMMHATEYWWFTASTPKQNIVLYRRLFQLNQAKLCCAWLRLPDKDIKAKLDRDYHRNIDRKPAVGTVFIGICQFYIIALLKQYYIYNKPSYNIIVCSYDRSHQPFNYVYMKSRQWELIYH